MGVGIEVGEGVKRDLPRFAVVGEEEEEEGGGGGVFGGLVGSPPSVSG